MPQKLLFLFFSGQILSNIFEFKIFLGRSKFSFDFYYSVRQCFDIASSVIAIYQVIEMLIFFYESSKRLELPAIVFVVFSDSIDHEFGI